MYKFLESWTTQYASTSSNTVFVPIYKLGTGTYNMVWREKHIQIFQDRNYELYITLLKQHYYKDVCNLGRIQCSVTYITSAGFTFVLGMLKPLSVIVNTAQKVTNWKKKTIVIKNVPICLYLLKTILKLKLLDLPWHSGQHSPGRVTGRGQFSGGQVFVKQFTFPSCNRML